METTGLPAEWEHHIYNFCNIFLSNSPHNHYLSYLTPNTITILFIKIQPKIPCLSIKLPPQSPSLLSNTHHNHHLFLCLCHPQIRRHRLCLCSGCDGNLGVWSKSGCLQLHQDLEVLRTDSSLSLPDPERPARRDRVHCPHCYMLLLTSSVARHFKYMHKSSLLFMYSVILQ